MHTHIHVNRYSQLLIGTNGAAAADKKQSTLDSFAKKPTAAAAPKPKAAAPVKKEAPAAAPAPANRSVLDDDDDEPITALLSKPVAAAAVKRPPVDLSDSDGEAKKPAVKVRHLITRFVSPFACARTRHGERSTTIHTSTSYAMFWMNTAI